MGGAPLLSPEPLLEVKDAGRLATPTLPVHRPTTQHKTSSLPPQQRLSVCPGQHTGHDTRRLSYSGWPSHQHSDGHRVSLCTGGSLPEQAITPPPPEEPVATVTSETRYSQSHTGTHSQSHCHLVAHRHNGDEQSGVRTPPATPITSCPGTCPWATRPAGLPHAHTVRPAECPELCPFLQCLPSQVALVTPAPGGSRA